MNLILLENQLHSKSPTAQDAFWPIPGHVSCETSRQLRQCLVASQCVHLILEVAHSNKAKWHMFCSLRHHSMLLASHVPWSQLTHKCF